MLGEFYRFTYKIHCYYITVNCVKDLALTEDFISLALLAYLSVLWVSS